MDRNLTLDDWICEFLEWSPVDDAAIEQSRESILLDALHLEAECVHILRQILDRGSRSPEALQLALLTLRNANDLLMDESRAWHALRAKHHWQLALTPVAAWEDHLDDDWMKALGHVADDVHELTGRILALQTYQA